MKEIFSRILESMPPLPDSPIKKTAILAMTFSCLWIVFNFIDCTINSPKELPNSVWFALMALIIIIGIWDSFSGNSEDDDNDSGGGGNDDPKADPPPDNKRIVDAFLKSYRNKPLIGPRK